MRYKTALHGASGSESAGGGASGGSSAGGSIGGSAVKTARKAAAETSATASGVDRCLGSTILANYALRAGTHPHLKQTTQNGVCYVGMRQASGRLPKAGWLHCSQLSPLEMHGVP